jgi:hypothetical protein
VPGPAATIDCPAMLIVWAVWACAVIIQPPERIEYGVGGVGGWIEGLHLLGKANGPTVGLRWILHSVMSET